MKTAIWLTSEAAECWNFREPHAEQMRAALPELSLEICSSAEEFRASLATAQIAIVWTIEDAWLDAAPRLEWLVTPAAGKDYFAVKKRPRIDHSYGSFQGEIIGETVVAWMAGHARGVLATRSLQSDGVWARRRLEPHLSSLRGSRVTIAGFGNIGKWIGRLAKPFGVQLTGVRRSTAGRPDFFDAGDRLLPADQLDRALPHTDYLVLSLPASASTSLLFDKDRLALLPRHAVLLNVGRGNAIDENALVERLTNDQLAAAYLDVFQDEPLPSSSPLWDCPKAFVSPHAAAIHPHYLDLFVREFIARFRKRYGQPQLEGLR